jgi:hypothetical protein
MLVADARIIPHLRYSAFLQNPVEFIILPLNVL